MTQGGFDPARAARAADVAHDYDALTGLTLVAMGCGFLAAALAREGLLIYAGLVASMVCARWYRRRFGVVRPGKDQVLRSTLVGAFGVVLVVALTVVDDRVSPPFSLTLLGWAAALCTVELLTLRRVGLTAVHWGVYAAMVLAALLPLAGVGGGAPVSPYVLTVVGCALVVVGLVDHVRLVRAMPPVPAEAGDRARA